MRLRAGKLRGGLSDPLPDRRNACDSVDDDRRLAEQATRLFLAALPHHMPFAEVADPQDPLDGVGTSPEQVREESPGASSASCSIVTVLRDTGRGISR